MFRIFKTYMYLLGIFAPVDVEGYEQGAAALLLFVQSPSEKLDEVEFRTS